MPKTAQLLLTRTIVACCLTVGAPAPVVPAPSDPGWKEFVVPDFGTRLEYPAGIFSESEGQPEVGTGERLRTPDGRASLTIYSRANETGETPSSYLRKNLKIAQSGMQYQRVTPYFFAISTEREGTIYYSRCNFSRVRGPSIHCFDLVYPQREKRARRAAWRVPTPGTSSVRAPGSLCPGYKPVRVGPRSAGPLPEDRARIRGGASIGSAHAGDAISQFRMS